MQSERLAALLLCAIAIAGCADSQPDEFNVPGGTGSDATQGGAAQPYVLTITVRDETQAGAPIADAAVVIARQDLVDTSFTDADGLRATALLALRTDESGRAVARLFPDQNVLVAAGGVDGRTDERLLGVRIGASGATGEVTIALFRARLPVALAGTVPQDITATQQPNPNDAAVIEVPFAFSDNPAINAAYIERLASATMELRWNNTPTEYADLYLGARVGEESFEGIDARQAPLAANNIETLAFEVTDPMTTSQGAALVLLRAPSASIAGVPFSIGGEGVFENTLVRVS